MGYKYFHQLNRYNDKARANALIMKCAVMNSKMRIIIVQMSNKNVLNFSLILIFSFATDFLRRIIGNSLKSIITINRLVLLIILSNINLKTFSFIDFVVSRTNVNLKTQYIQLLRYFRFQSYFFPFY